MADLIFIGGIGKVNEFGGELSKNKLILNRIKSLGYDVIAVDTHKAHRNPLKIWKLPAIIAANPNTSIAFSTNYANIELMSKLIRRVYPKRKMTLWIIGGSLAEEVANGNHSINDLNIFATKIGESRRLCENLERLGITNTMYMPNFKDLSLSATSPDKALTLDNSLRCVFMSRITPYKGVDIILDALDDERIKSKNITIDFYGEVDENYRARFFERLTKHDNVRYIGTLNFFDGSGQKALSKYHLSLFPTFWEGEGFPGAIVDSLAAGVPILTSDWRFNSEYITPDTGFICKARSVDDFAEKLMNVYENRTDLPRYFAACVKQSQDYDVVRLIDRKFIESTLI